MKWEQKTFGWSYFPSTVQNSKIYVSVTIPHLTDWRHRSINMNPNIRTTVRSWMLIMICPIQWRIITSLLCSMKASISTIVMRIWDVYFTLIRCLICVIASRTCCNGTQLTQDKFTSIWQSKSQYACLNRTWGEYMRKWWLYFVTWLLHKF